MTGPEDTVRTSRGVDLATVLGWMRAGAGACRRAVADLTDAGAAAPSGLPGWSRGHLLSHLARNADALVNLLTWARTGVATPMYASAAQRDADIAAGAGRDAAALRADLAEADERLSAAVAAMAPEHWWARVRSAQGRGIPAADVPWLRTREVWIHGVDLACGLSVADFPAELVDTLLTDVTAAFTARGDCPPLRLAATDRDRTWAVEGDVPEPAHLAGTAGDLLAWLVGRGSAAALSGPGADRAPVPPPWL